jgi:hypothetical protein
VAICDDLNLTEWFNELLRLVYRLIFVMVAEHRSLLHPEKAESDVRKVYGEGYSLVALRAQCFRRAAWDEHAALAFFCTPRAASRVAKSALVRHPDLRVATYMRSAQDD